MSQLLAAVSCLAAVSVLLWQLRKPHAPEKLFTNRVKAAAPEETSEEPETAPEENTEE